jgi:murein DD-endopeptidase MepM/ murein hydrolase activator NlpD
VARDAAGLRQALLAAIRGERDLQEAVIEELARAQAELEATIHALPRGERRGFAGLRGRLPPPVARGVVEVPFGKMVNPRFNTVTFQRGQDVRAPEGTEVIAVADGRVVHAGWFGGYGNLVIVDHGEGYHSLYAHLAATARGVGDEVRQGAIIGLVGDTGSLKGPYLYFEIRENGKPVDPRDWLVRGGP